MMKATKASLWFVYAGYLLMGELLLIIFWPSLHGIQNDVISILPNDSSLSLLIKLSMIVVILSTVPVIIVPFGDLVQRKLGMGSESSNDSTKASEGTIIRISICIVCTLVSIFIPNFVYVISFLGCLCVSLISYAYPPLAHIICYDKVHRSSSSKSSSELQQLCLDGSILLVGIVSCIFTSYLTFQKMMEELRHM
jgi:amino acid permease